MIHRPRSHRRRRIPTRWALTGTLALGTLLGLTASNVVPSSRAADDSRQAAANDIKPVECAVISLASKVSGAGTFNGTSLADLMTGSAGADTMDGLQGDDCLVAGGGADSLRGGPGFDVCIGGPGVDTFHPTCEVQIQ